MKEFFRKWTSSRLWDVLWGIMILLIPLTSVPMIVKLVRSDVVAAPSALILPFLLLGWILPRLIIEKKIPASAEPLLLFILSAVLLTLISLFRVMPPFKDIDPLSPTVSAILTLFIGFGFYLVSLYYNGSEKRFHFTGKLLDITGGVVCGWTLLQAFCWFTSYRYPEWMKNIQFTLSIGSLYRQRFVGFTLEPSWLAHQMNLLWLPWWFAASITGASAFSFRKKWLTVERILFPIGMAVLFMTLSRVGLGAFLMTVLFLGLVLVYRLGGKLAEKTGHPEKRSLITAAAFFAVLILLGIIGFGILWILSKLDFRMANLFNIRWTGRTDSIFYLAEKLSLAARFVYWDGGLTVFNEHPILGVGLGHAGFYMPAALNEYAYRLVEVRDLLFNSQTLLNIKSFWIRILAETGIVGFSFFLIWYLCSFLGLKNRLHFDRKLSSAAAWMGCFVMIAFLLEGFSLDTFALPYFWISLGIANAFSEIH